MEKSLYPETHLKEKKSRRYILIKIKNVAGIINRISSLFRRRKYNIIEFSVDLKRDLEANIVVIIDGKSFDIKQIINQIGKLYDVIECLDVTEKSELLYYSFSINSQKNNIGKYDEMKSKEINFGENFKLIYFVNTKNKDEFEEYLIENNYYYSERLITLF